MNTDIYYAFHSIQPFRRPGFLLSIPDPTGMELSPPTHDCHPHTHTPWLVGSTCIAGAGVAGGGFVTRLVRAQKYQNLKHCCASVPHGNRAPVDSAAKPKSKPPPHNTHNNTHTSRASSTTGHQNGFHDFRSGPACCILRAVCLAPPRPFQNARSAGCCCC